MNDPKAQPMFERQRDLEDRTDGPDVWSAVEASDKRAAPLVGTGDWFDVLDAAWTALHNVQYPLRAMELPPYPAGGTCGIANLGTALDHIVAAQNALNTVKDQLSHWTAMNEAYGPSSNTPVTDAPRSV